MSSNYSAVQGLSRQRGYSTSHMWPARSPDLNPIENVSRMLWGGRVAGQKLSPTNKNTLIRALTEEWDKLPQQLLDNVVQVWYDDVECCIHSTVDISRTGHLSLRCLLTFRCIVPFLRTQIK
ncbi:hypothetical protein TNCV_791371 [Trichonephila clavipes]|nr:hypothetical protein TNCV_791371 [Trichonephila clavipes]